jgi:hypothetical protein
VASEASLERKYSRWRPFIMNRLIILLTLVTFSSYGQEKDLEIEKHLRGPHLTIVKSFIDAGHRDFMFVDRMHPGLMYFEKYDSCKDESFLNFILVKVNDSNKYEFIKYDNCGQTQTTTESKAIRFFEENRRQIRRDTIVEKVYIDHTVFYSLYEFRDSRLKTYKYFCKACVDWDEDKSTKNKNQNLKLYQFFRMLDSELLELIK